MEAIESFERAKALDESLSQAADFQIALCYMEERKLKEAKEQFQASVLVRPGTDLAYFARRYQLHMQSVLWEPDIVPTEEQWQQLIYAQEAFPASWMLWEAEPAAETRARLEKHGIHSVVFDTCANTPENCDFISVMRANIDRLGNIFQ